MPRYIAVIVPVLICTVLLGTATRTASVPQTERVRMHALAGPYDFYPASLPPGLMYLKWKRTALSPMACGKNLSIVFTSAEKEIDWSSSRDCNANANVACHADGYPGYGFIMSATDSAKINGRRVYFSHPAIMDQMRGLAFRCASVGMRTWRSSVYGKLS